MQFLPCLSLSHKRWFAMRVVPWLLLVFLFLLTCQTCSYPQNIQILFPLPEHSFCRYPLDMAHPSQVSPFWFKGTLSRSSSPESKNRSCLTKLFNLYLALLCIALIWYHVFCFLSPEPVKITEGRKWVLSIAQQILRRVPGQACTRNLEFLIV